MKRSLFVIACLCLCSLPVMAQGVALTFQWDPMPAGQAWTNVRLYEISGTTYTLKGTVSGSATTYTLTGVAPGSHIYIVRSVAGTIESPDSNSVSKDIQPGAPSNFKIVMVHIGEDGTVTVRLVDPAEFFRG